MVPDTHAVRALVHLIFAVVPRQKRRARSMAGVSARQNHTQAARQLLASTHLVQHHAWLPSARHTSAALQHSVS